MSFRVSAGKLEESERAPAGATEILLRQSVVIVFFRP